MKTPYLFAAIHMVCASLIGWIGIVGVLVADRGTLTNILICIAVSFVLAVPIAWFISKKMLKR